MSDLRRCRTVGPRRGIGVVLALACVLLTSAVSTSLVRSTLMQLEQARRALWREQARWLALSAESRAAAVLRARPDFRGDGWQVQLSSDGKKGQAGTTQTRIEAVPGHPHRRRIRVLARFPADDAKAERFEHSVVVHLPTTPDGATSQKKVPQSSRQVTSDGKAGGEKDGAF